MYPQNEPQKIHKYRLGIIGAVNIWGKTQQQSRNRHHFMLNSNVVQSHSNNLYRSFITTIKRIKQIALPWSWKKGYNEVGTEKRGRVLAGLTGRVCSPFKLVEFPHELNFFLPSEGARNISRFDRLTIGGEGRIIESFPEYFTLRPYKSATRGKCHIIYNSEKKGKGDPKNFGGCRIRYAQSAQEFFNNFSAAETLNFSSLVCCVRLSTEAAISFGLKLYYPHSPVN